MKNIVLIGMTGAGKSTIGKLLSEKLNCKFFDIDKIIEERENTTITEIFNNFGEKYFRELESKYLKEISLEKECVIATGGGAVKCEENMVWLKKNGIIIFIDRKIEKIYNENLSDRPLLKNKNNLYLLYKERIDLYKKYSDVIVENNNSLEEVVEKVIEKINFYYEK